MSLNTGFAAGLLVLMCLSTLLPLPGCGRRGDEARTRLDTLRTDRERLTIVNDLPAGTSYEEVRRRLPTLGPATAARDGEGTEATAPFPVLGHAATLTLGFGSDGLAHWRYRLDDPDSAASASTYHRLQGIYTMEFGNYHEEWSEGGDETVSRSFWSSPTFGVTVVLRSRTGACRLEWWFEPLENIIRETV